MMYIPPKDVIMRYQVSRINDFLHYKSIDGITIHSPYSVINLNLTIKLVCSKANRVNNPFPLVSSHFSVTRLW